MKRSSAQAIAAGHRWKILRSAVLKENTPDDATLVSVRRFTTFDIVRTRRLPQIIDGDWFEYSLPPFDVTLAVKHCNETLASDMFSFNNTGNVCVWPSEEILAYYCMEKAETLRGLSVCELGGGMTCLAGLFLAKSCEASKILLTDGNQKSIDNVSEIIKKNTFQCKDINSRLLRWEALPHDLDHVFDRVICADCLFFDESHSSLLRTLDSVLTAQGEVWLMAPPRGRTLNDFVALAGKKFSVQVRFDYHDHVMKLHRLLLMRGKDIYDPNLHYPILIKLFRKLGGRK